MTARDYDCHGCGKTFRTFQQRKRYCSLACRWKKHYGHCKRHRERKGQQRLVTMATELEQFT